MAWRKLAVALSNTRASQERQILATTKAYQYRDRLPEVERQFTIAYYYGNVDVDPAKEEAAYRRLLAVSPENYGATNNLALFLGRMGRFAEAESVAAPMVRSATTVGNMHMQLLNAQLAQGHTDDVRRTLETMARLDSTAPVYLRGRATALGVLGEYDSAQRAWLDVGLKLRDPSYQSMASMGLASLAQTQGRLAEAERQAQLNIGISRTAGTPGRGTRG